MNEITNIVEKPTLLKQDIELSKLIYTIRGKQIMLDCDLAILYGYTVKRLNEQVKNNKNRFPEDFMFQMTREEVNDLRLLFFSLFNISNSNGIRLHYALNHLPFVV